MAEAYRAALAEFHPKAFGKSFLVSTGAVLGMGMGLFIAFQLAFPHLNFEPYFNFGRIRPVHTTGVVFGFAGNILFATSFFVVQRTCRVRLCLPALSPFYGAARPRRRRSGSRRPGTR